MTVAQIVKHVDGSVPVRFLIAETETGYTLLTALWLARLFGIELEYRPRPNRTQPVKVNWQIGPAAQRDEIQRPRLIE